MLGCEVGLRFCPKLGVVVSLEDLAADAGNTPDIALAPHGCIVGPTTHPAPWANEPAGRLEVVGEGEP